jgi:hypothetical protein
VSQETKVLKIAVRRILLCEWDPIGVKAIMEAQDEYDAYVDSICELLLSGSSREEVCDYLRWVETEVMGLEGEEQRISVVAGELTRLPTNLG